MTQVLSNPLALVGLLIAAVIVGMLVMRHGMKTAPGKVEQTVEADGFALLVRGIKALADTSAEDQAIQAAQQRKALKAAQLDHARTVLAGIAPSSQQPPSAS